MDKSKDEVQKLKDIIQVQREIIAWYEDDHDLSEYDESEIPKELRNLYKQLDGIDGIL